jgi:hypothetical protein
MFIDYNENIREIIIDVKKKSVSTNRIVKTLIFFNKIC